MHYVTKYALTSGIQERADLKEGEGGRVSLVVQYGVESFQLGEDCFRTREEAVAAAEAARAKKIASLEKQIAKLRKLTFA